MPKILEFKKQWEEMDEEKDSDPEDEDEDEE